MPEDEHDGYVGNIAAMLREGASGTDLLECLEWADVKHMGLDRLEDSRLPVHQQCVASVVAILRGIRMP